MISINKVNFADPVQSRSLVDVLNAYASDPMGGGEPLSEFAKENLAIELARRPTAHAFLAFLNEDPNPVGLAICFEGFSTFECRPLLNIHDLVVIPSGRRRGVATSLLFFIERFAQSINCCKITLEVLEGNHVAKSLYSGAGFAAYELDPQVGAAMFWQKAI